MAPKVDLEKEVDASAMEWIVSWDRLLTKKSSLKTAFRQTPVERLAPIGVDTSFKTCSFEVKGSWRHEPRRNIKTVSDTHGDGKTLPVEALTEAGEVSGKNPNIDLQLGPFGSFGR